MGTFDELRELVDELRDDRRRPVRGLSGVVGERVPSPSCHLNLAAWATEIAETVHSRFGEDVAVTVGALSFPDQTFPTSGGGVVVHRPPRTSRVSVPTSWRSHSATSSPSRLAAMW